VSRGAAHRPLHSSTASTIRGAAADTAGFSVAEGGTVWRRPRLAWRWRSAPAAQLSAGPLGGDADVETGRTPAPFEHGMNRVYIARHGESIWNAERRWTGHGDPPLSDAGRAQAREACTALSGHHFDAVGSSSLVRALETASIIASSLGLPQLKPIRHFDERFAGSLSGMSSAEIETHWPGFLDQWRSGVPVEIPCGESWHAFVDRVFVGLGLLETVPGRILVVSHMGVQRAIEHGLGKPLAWYDNVEGLWVAAEDLRAVVSRRPTSGCS
jgi:broad specificity phosphatase PhoE